MGHSVFGLEAELAVSAAANGEALPVRDVVGALARVAERTLPHLRGGGSRMFLANGGLLYIDCGNHPEVATPECATPSEAVCHLLAGQRMVARLAGLVRGELGAEQVLVCRANVDYVGGNTWGCHESQLGRRPVAAYESWLVPHVASRIVYTGSGGLDPSSPGIRLSLSPRVAHIEQVVSPESTSSRGIFHTRDEALCKGYSRVHVLAGDNACSQRATWLKMGATALVVALADCKSPTVRPVRLVDPVGAMKRFARDPRHKALVELPGGAMASMTAVDIQRHLLALIEPHANGSRFPDWAAAVCQAWNEALDLVETPAINTSHAFDWPLKFGLFRREMARQGYTEPMTAAWSDALERVSRLWRPGSPRPLFVDQAQIDILLDNGVLSRAEIAVAGRVLAEQGLSWAGLDEFNALRRRLCAIDVSFGEIGAGIFESLDRQGVIPDHRVVTEMEIAAADAEAPTGTRAAVRARWVGKLAGQRDRYLCSWSGISGEHVRLDLGDPFATTGQWEPAQVD